MKYHIITLLALTLSAGACLGQSEAQRTDSLLDALQRQVQTMQSQVADLSEPDQAMKVLQTQVSSLHNEQAKLNSTQQGLGDQLNQLKEEVRQVDKDGRNGRWSLGSRLNSLKASLAEGDSTMQVLSSSLDEVDDELSQANSAIAAQDSSLVATKKKVDDESATRMEADSSAMNLTFLGYLMAILVGVVAFILGKKAAVAAADSAKSDLSDEIRRTRTEMDAGMLKVDQKLMESLSKISIDPPGPTGVGNEPDHSLALKVADEINRMENNLSRMDPEVKGHKQLTRSIKNVRNNMKANGYELIAHLGKPFDEGLLLEADFKDDETLATGERVITRVIRPEVRYEEKVIQTAEVQVSQGV